MGGVTENPGNIEWLSTQELLERQNTMIRERDEWFGWLSRTQGQIVVETEADVVSREVEDDATLEDMGFWQD